MHRLQQFDWGAVVLALLALAFFYVVVRAVQRLARGRGSAEAEGAERPERRDSSARSAPDAGRAAAPDQRRARSAPTVPTIAAPGAATRADDRARIDRGLARTRGGFVARLGQLFRGGAALDEALLAQVEEVLFTADIGVRTSQQLLDGLRRELGRGDRSAERAWQELQRAARALLEGPDQGPPIRFAATGPTVILVVGVNGTGKTTTVGKLGARLQREGRRVLLAAGDTYRAAAADQLAIWAERAGATLVRGKEGADPTSVIVEALQRARNEGFDVVLADTAGRLHTKVVLMEELQKVHRSIAKQIAHAPHETLLVLDATTGQNAITQAQLFREATAVTGIVLTKLDGTAKGGVVLGIANELQLPVRFIGVGEQVEDLRPFDAALFAEALFAHDGAPGPVSAAAHGAQGIN